MNDRVQSITSNSRQPLPILTNTTISTHGKRLMSSVSFHPIDGLGGRCEWVVAYLREQEEVVQAH